MVAPAIIAAGIGAGGSILSSLMGGKGGGGATQPRSRPAVPVNIAPSTDVPLISFEDLLAGNIPFSNSPSFNVSAGSGSPTLASGSTATADSIGGPIFSALGEMFAQRIGTSGGGKGQGGGGSSAGLQSINSIGPSLTAGG
jgi:hypothetical protein